MQMCRVGHVDSDGVLHTRPLASEQYLSLKLETAHVAKGKGRIITGRKYMDPTDKRGGDYSRYLAVQELFRELTPLLSLMCIPLCFSVQPFLLYVPR